MELADLKLFAAVAREGSISRGAAALHMAQPSVSQRLAGMEAELGQPLFTRHRRGVSLTPEGQVFLEYVHRTLSLLDEGLSAVRAAGSGRLRIRLAAPASVGGYFLPPLLDHLAAAGHDVMLRDAHSGEVFGQVLDGTADAGFVLGAQTVPGVRQTEVARDPLLCVTAPDHPLTGRGPLRMADLRGSRLALYAFSWELEALRERLAAAAGEPLRGILAVSPAEAARALADRGYITFLPQMIVAGRMAAGSLVALPVADLPPYSWRISVAYRDRKTPCAEAAAVLEAVRRLFGAG